MLNHSDYVITALQFPYESEDPWAVVVKFKNRKNGKLSEALFGEKEGWMKVSKQCFDQIKTSEHVAVSHQPKPKARAAAAPAPAPVKGKGKKKG